MYMSYVYFIFSICAFSYSFFPSFSHKYCKPPPPQRNSNVYSILPFVNKLGVNSHATGHHGQSQLCQHVAPSDKTKQECKTSGGHVSLWPTRLTLTSQNKCIKIHRNKNSRGLVSRLGRGRVEPWRVDVTELEELYYFLQEMCVSSAEWQEAEGHAAALIRKHTVRLRHNEVAINQKTSGGVVVVVVTVTDVVFSLCVKTNGSSSSRKEDGGVINTHVNQLPHF